MQSPVQRKPSVHDTGLNVNLRHISKTQRKDPFLRKHQRVINTDNIRSHKNITKDGGNRNYDLWNASPMLCQRNYAVISVGDILVGESSDLDINVI